MPWIPGIYKRRLPRFSGVLKAPAVAPTPVLLSAQIIQQPRRIPRGGVVAASRFLAVSPPSPRLIGQARIIASARQHRRGRVLLATVPLVLQGVAVNPPAPIRYTLLRSDRRQSSGRVFHFGILPTPVVIAPPPPSKAIKNTSIGQISLQLQIRACIVTGDVQKFKANKLYAQNSLGADADVLRVPTTPTAFTFDEVQVPGFLYLQCLDSTYSVRYGSLFGGIFQPTGLIKPGEVHLIRLFPGAVFAMQSETSPAIISYYLCED